MARKKAKTASKRSRLSDKVATPGGWTAHRSKAKSGRASGPKTLDASKREARSLAAREEMNEPRPYKWRYPCSKADFLKFKEAATATPPKKAKRALRATEAEPEAVVDRGIKKPVATPGVSNAAFAAPAAAPTQSRNFDGIRATGWLPPDCTLAAGPAHVLASVNSSLALYRKSGTRVFQRTLTSWFANVPAVRGATIFDPKALYDQHSGRWVLLALAINRATSKSWYLLSVSKSSDPNGGWWNYALDATVDGRTQTNNWADFPGLGVDSRAIYITSNQFRFGGNFAYTKIRVIPKARPYAGQSVNWWDFTRMRDSNRDLSFTIQPCHTYGGSFTEYLVNSRFGSGNYLTLWSIRFSAAGTPALFSRNVRTASYNLPPDARQRGGGTNLDTGDTRIYHAVFRGGSIYTALTTRWNWGSGGNVSAIRWFEVSPGGTLRQQGTYGARGRFYYYPAMAVDTNGNATMVFARSGRTEFASARYTGRRASDAPNRLQGSAPLRMGLSNYVGLDGGGRNRWGDYNGIATDPVDGRTIWMYAPYAARTSNRWGTRIGASRF